MKDRSCYRSREIQKSKTEQNGSCKKKHECAGTALARGYLPVEPAAPKKHRRDIKNQHGKHSFKKLHGLSMYPLAGALSIGFVSLSVRRTKS